MGNFTNFNYFKKGIIIIIDSITIGSIDYYFSRVCILVSFKDNLYFSGSDFDFKVEVNINY